MTTRSTRSAMSAKDRMTDGDVYVFLMQAAVLSWVLQPNAPKEQSPGGTPGASTQASLGKRTGTDAAASSSSSSNSRSDWISLGGLADMVRDVSGSSKTVRFPEKLLKRLSERLEQIAMGRDPHYRDQSFRQTIGIFYGTYKEASFQKQMKENRKIEELILLFVTTAQGALRKRLEGDAWKEELNKQASMFVKIIRECLRTIHGVSRELTERLDNYATKLMPGPITLSQQPSANNGSADAANAASVDSRRGSAASTALTTTVGSEQLYEHALVKAVGKLFDVEKEQLHKDVDFMRKTCTEQNAMLDLKQCIRNINLQQSWPARREDFQSDEGFNEWRSSELQSISNIMMQMCKANPELLKTSSTESAALPSEISAAASSNSIIPDAEAVADAVESEGDAASGGFKFIPPDPKAYYRRALELCIDQDLEQIRYQPEEEEVSLSILSKTHVDLLGECMLRWRIMSTYRIVSNLDVIKYKYDRGEVPLDCVTEALASVERAIEEKSLDKWTRVDSKLLHSDATALFESFLRYIHDAFQDLHNVPLEEIRPFIELIEEMHDSGFVKIGGDPSNSVISLDTYAEDLKDRIRIMAIHEYTEMTTDLFSQQIDNEVAPLLALVDWIEKGAKTLDTTYPESIFERIDPVSLQLEKQVRLFLDDLDSMKNQIVDHAQREHDALPFEDIFHLFNRVQGLLRMHAAFCPGTPTNFDLHEWFEPQIRHWLAMTDKKTAEWVHNALATDNFVPIDSEGAVHSSSIDDLFGALQQPLDFILSLQWPDPYRNARFLTSMAKTVSRCIEMYCSKVEEAFTEEMFPRTMESTGAEKQSAWMVKAKQTLQGEKKVDPFHFQPASCVKLNNIEAARILLDKLYSKMDADEQARVIKATEPTLPEKKQKQRYIFTIKIVLGENLQPLSHSSASARIDSFVTLSDERGAKIAKTRTIYETADPRWDEAFDITVEGNMWLAATVWDRKLVGDHNLCGRAYLRLDPRYFDDFLNHELWLSLDTQGRLLFRVSMEGEKDDILFHFGRAFRSLKRAESDMVRIIVDKMSIYIRQCLSRSVLRSLVKTSGINLDKALGNVKALYAQALASTNASSSMIPPVHSELPKKQRPQQLTDIEIEEAIMPLLDYLDECLGTLKSSLSENEALVVLTKVWKEVLNTIEGILLPPLSDGHSDMPQLSGKEVEVVFKWLSMLRNYFNAYDEESGVAHGVSLEILQGPKYREIVSYTLFHDAPTDDLMESCVREMQKRLSAASQKRNKSKSVLQQRSLGTIKKRKADKRTDEQSIDDNLDVILRLLRMRSGTSDFLQQQFATLARLQSAMGSTPSVALPTKLQQGPPPASMQHLPGHQMPGYQAHIGTGGRKPYPQYQPQNAQPFSPAGQDQQHQQYFPSPQQAQQQHQLQQRQHPLSQSTLRNATEAPPSSPQRPSLNARLSRTVQQRTFSDGRNVRPGY